MAVVNRPSVRGSPPNRSALIAGNRATGRAKTVAARSARNAPLITWLRRIKPIPSATARGPGRAVPRSASPDPTTPPKAGANPATPPKAGANPATPPKAGADPATPPNGRIAGSLAIPYSAAAKLTVSAR